ncbi:hypothetical protein [Algisphaera agarilytica]|uniref:Excisionase family DNA binding protein n=1 Tax=Algisphaera agarilytica TaxID=1385975 RepID=A0A7X0LKF4_9BACT|nr:hypothetical protein [Algisphaera agarilytica]MBB6429586.1 excisionase family DNA binding protein [Algisphaera agarilytica]
MKQSLSPKELAQVIGVSESSLKRWADDGRVRVTRTAGGHRRITLQEAVRFAREAHMPIVRPELLGIHQAGKLSSQARPVTAEKAAVMLEKMLVNGHTDEARGLLLDLFLKGKSLAWICDGPINLAMARIGEIWAHNSKGIYIEHNAIDVCIHALTQMRLLITPPALSDAVPEDEPARPYALGGGPPNDPYLLGSLMAACICAEAGYNDINLGANLPLESLAEATEEYHPKLVWLSCSYTEAAPSPKAIDQLAEQLGTLGAKLVVGGQAGPRGDGGSENLCVCDSMGELSAFAKGLLAT